MIHIKIYNKGHGKTHIYAKADCPRRQMGAQLAALLVSTCKIAHDALAGLDRDTFLQMMGAAWDEAKEGGKSET